MLKTFSPLRLFMVVVSLSIAMISSSVTSAGSPKEGPEVKKALVIGDSMAGWLGERLNSYGQKNGFEVGTIVWDGATIEKYANSSTLKGIIDTQNPEVVFVCLGMNNLADPAPAHLKSSIDKIRAAVGDRELVWVGPPSWPGKPQWTKLNSWLEQEIGSDRYYNSFPLTLARQSATNPHPTKEGIQKWGDALAQWLSESNLNFPGMDKPTAQQFIRGKFFLYKKMKDRL